MKNKNKINLLLLSSFISISTLLNTTSCSENQFNKVYNCDYLFSGFTFYNSTQSLKTSNAVVTELRSIDELEYYLKLFPSSIVYVRDVLTENDNIYNSATGEGLVNISSEFVPNYQTYSDSQSTDYILKPYIFIISYDEFIKINSLFYKEASKLERNVYMMFFKNGSVIREEKYIKNEIEHNDYFNKPKVLIDAIYETYKISNKVAPMFYIDSYGDNYGLPIFRNSITGLTSSSTNSFIGDLLGFEIVDAEGNVVEDLGSTSFNNDNATFVFFDSYDDKNKQFLLETFIPAYQSTTDISLVIVDVSIDKYADNAQTGYHSHTFDASSYSVLLRALSNYYQDGDVFNIYTKTPSQKYDSERLLKNSDYNLDKMMQHIVNSFS